MNKEGLKALFITTRTNDVDKLVGAWDCWNEIKATRWAYDESSPRHATFEPVKNFDVVFYIGGCCGSGNPEKETLRSIAMQRPFIHICCDAGDEPWWQALRAYRQDDCFTKQVGIDGHHDAPVDLVTLTPVDMRPYINAAPKAWSMRAHAIGFPGNAGSGHRIKLINDLRDVIAFRRRDPKGDYADYVNFLADCRMVLNSALSGTAATKHVKGRVLEAAFAGCGLIEMAGAPTHEFIPEELFLTYQDSAHVAELAKNMNLQEEKLRADKLFKYCAQEHNPRKIYQRIMEGV
mgnify:CR=1 FL=1